jgi:hypothetical protein
VCLEVPLPLSQPGGSGGVRQGGALMRQAGGHVFGDIPLGCESGEWPRAHCNIFVWGQWWHVQMWGSDVAGRVCVLVYLCTSALIPLCCIDSWESAYAGGT